METISVPSAKDTQKKLKEILNTPRDCTTSLCPVKDVLHKVGDKWSVFVMMALGAEKTLRFNELKNTIDGISQKMLTVTVRDLESFGLIDRKIYPQIPPKVEYTLTAKGEEFLQHLVVLLDWACRYSKNEQAASN
ncbi:transcriptional regulator [Flavobacterium magnum]|uniref:Transcriptional regulator n=1 Tax=Flavobacterium magnum TaxID=2162713 RepID=A0A2S0RD05_9FLAO|nr:helix-turn-helix domain-containing protein [Flavobacterium magnum]AWA28981.1 transcriptional regulator [Flavobacterium magnum]